MSTMSTNKYKRHQEQDNLSTYKYKRHCSRVIFPPCQHLPGPAHLQASAATARHWRRGGKGKIGGEAEKAKRTFLKRQFTLRLDQAYRFAIFLCCEIIFGCYSKFLFRFLSYGNLFEYPFFKYLHLTTSS